MKTVEQKTFKQLGVEWIGIELNNTCNIKCTFCPISYKELQRKSNERLMPFALVRKIINEIIKDGTLDHVILNDYGEPFLYPRFKDVLQLCKENGVRMRFATNGTLFTHENVDLIRKYEPEEVVISIQYFLRDNYKKVKGALIDFDAWLKQIADFLRVIIDEKLNTKVQIAIACNYNNSLRNRIFGLRCGDANLSYPDKTFFAKLDSFIKEFCEKRLHIPYYPEKTNKNITKQTYNKYYQIDENISFELKDFIDSTNFYNFKESMIVYCSMPYLVINSQGKVIMCCADYIGGTALGNVNDKEIKNILLEKYVYFVNENNEKVNFKICRRCAGEITYRGLLLRQLWYLMKIAIKRYSG
ncbi:MAG: radical SAM protein [Candidatus Scalindua sediminis]|nr:radical SAM protein [Candidatus Scalindua sediminis]